MRPFLGFTVQDYADTRVHVSRDYSVAYADADPEHIKGRE